MAGAAIWTETFLGVPVSLGGFSVILGSTNPLTLAFDTQYYLGIAVNAGAELTPRVVLASTPYSLSLRIPFNGVGTSAGAAFRIQNQGSGYAITADPKMSVGTPTADGRIDIFMNGVANPVEQLLSFSGLGGGAEYIDEAGNNMGGFEPDFDGAGGFLYANGGPVGGYWYLDGNSDGAGNPFMIIAGTGSTSYFNSAVAGDGSVVLPTDAVSSGEMLNEPGVTQGKFDGRADVVSTASMADVVTTSLNTPSDGYIVVEAAGQLGLSSAGAGIADYISFQIDETAGGSVDGNHYSNTGYGSDKPTGTTWLSVSTRRTYFKSAGAYTFRLEAQKFGDATTQAWLWNPIITATFIPTSYGTVSEAPEGLSATVSGNDGSSVGSGQPASTDLRELEVRAAQATAEAERAQRQLVEARYHAQMQKAEVARTAAKPKQ